MKQLKLITSAIMIASGMTFIACNSSTEKSDATDTENTSDKMTTTNAVEEKAEAYPVGEVGKGPNGGTIEEAEPNHIEIMSLESNFFPSKVFTVTEGIFLS